VKHGDDPSGADGRPDKVFALEHKGVDERSDGTPFVQIRLRQLLTHLDADRRAGGNLVYYVCFPIRSGVGVNPLRTASFPLWPSGGRAERHGLASNAGR
jgi:hypothetical protein